MHQQALDKVNAAARHPDAQAGFVRQLDLRITHHLSQLSPAPARLVEAARDAMSSGKRLRPYLLHLVAGDAADGDAVLDMAVALEMVHTASLIVDDLPSMDNALLRRGRPTTHARFGEATAILTAIGLLNHAISIANGLEGMDDRQRGALVAILSGVMGWQGLVAGQELDLNGFSDADGADDALDRITRINALKTGALLCAAVEAGARQIECTINGLGERAGNTALEEVVMALKVRHDIMPFTTGIDTTKIMGISRRVAQVSGFPVQFNKAIVGKNAFLHESGIHQDGVLKNVETFEIMRPADIGLNETNIAMGKHSGRAALRAKLADLGYDVGDNQLKDIFVRFKALADRKKEVYDEDIVALVQDASANTGDDFLQVKHLRVVCGSDGQSADLTMIVDGAEQTVHATGDGPVDACFNAVKQIFPHNARLKLYQVHAVTEGTDAQATVSVRMEEDGRIVNGQASDTDTILASVKAYVGALNHLIVRRTRAGRDGKEISMYSH